MHAFVTREPLGGDVDFPDPEDATPIFSWRKRPNLHGWMEALYRERGGTAEHFSGVNLRLAAADLQRLQADIRNRRLPKTSGVFFGGDEDSDEEMENDLQFIAMAREALAVGYSVYYTSWW